MKALKDKNKKKNNSYILANYDPHGNDIKDESNRSYNTANHRCPKTKTFDIMIVIPFRTVQSKNFVILVQCIIIEVL